MSLARRLPTRILLALATCLLSSAISLCRAQTAEDSDERNIQDLITASHILANEGVLDSFGHATVRSVQNPSHLFMPRAMPPALVTRADIVELDSDCNLVAQKAVRLNGERYIHCEIYKVRPDVQSVIHTHDPAVLPFGLSRTPMRAVLAQAGFLPAKAPVFDIRNVPLQKKGMLILNPVLGRALAKSLGAHPVVLMRGHGDTVVGKSVREAAVRAIYTDMNARAQAAAIALGSSVVALNAAERAAYDAEQRPDRPWENFRQRLPEARAAPSPKSGP